MLGASRPPQPLPSPDRLAHPPVTPLVRSLARLPLRPRKVKTRRRWVEPRAILHAGIFFRENSPCARQMSRLLMLSRELFPRGDTRDTNDKCARIYASFFFMGERDYSERSKLLDILKISTLCRKPSFNDVKLTRVFAKTRMEIKEESRANHSTITIRKIDFKSGI